MAVVAADLTFPTGEIQPQWFEGQDLPALLATWIGIVEPVVPPAATPEQADAIVTAYAYWRAYSAIYMRMAGDPNSVALSGELSAGWAPANTKAFFTRAEWWRLRYEAEVAGVEETVAAETVRVPLGGPAPIVYVF